MRFFWIGLVLIVVCNSLQGSTTTTKRSVKALNGTLQAHVDGTYIRKHPEDDSKVEKASYKATHEVIHHSPDTDWSDYAHKYSVLINSFFNSLRALVGSEKNEKEDFHFNVNTTFSAADGNCPAGANCALPTITIEATDLKIPCKNDCGNLQIVQWGRPKGQKEIRLKVKGQDYNCYPKGTIPSLLGGPQVQPSSTDSMTDVPQGPIIDRPTTITDFPGTFEPPTSQALPVPFPNEEPEVNGFPETPYFYTTIPPPTLLTDTTVNCEDQAVTNEDEAIPVTPPIGITKQPPVTNFSPQSTQSPIGAIEDSFSATPAVDFQKPLDPNSVRGSDSLIGPGISEQPTDDCDESSSNVSSQYPGMKTGGPVEVPFEYPDYSVTFAPGQSLADDSQIRPELPSSVTVAPEFSQTQNPTISETTPLGITNSPTTEPCESEEQPHLMTLEPQTDYTTVAPTPPVVNPTDYARPFPIDNPRPGYTNTYAPPGVFPNVYETVQSEQKPITQTTSLTPETQILNDVTLAPETGFTPAIQPPSPSPFPFNEGLNYFPSPAPVTPLPTATTPQDLNKNYEGFTPIPDSSKPFTQNSQTTTAPIVSSYIHPAGPQPQPESSIHVPDPISDDTAMPSPFQEPSTSFLNNNKPFIPAIAPISHNNPPFVSTLLPSKTHEMFSPTPEYIKPEQKSFSSEEECTSETPNGTPEEQPESGMTRYSTISPLSLPGSNDPKLNPFTFPNNEGITPTVLPTFTPNPMPEQFTQTQPSVVDPIAGSSEGSSATTPYQTFNEEYFTSDPPYKGIMKEEEPIPAPIPQATSKTEQPSPNFTPMPTTPPFGFPLVPESQPENLIYSTPSGFSFRPVTTPSPPLPPVMESQPQTKDLVTSDSLFGKGETGAPHQFPFASSNTFNEAFITPTPMKHVENSFEAPEAIPPTFLNSMPSNPDTSFEAPINTNPTSTMSSRPLVTDLPEAPFSSTQSSLPPTPQNPGAANPTPIPTHQPFITNPSLGTEMPSTSFSEMFPGAESPLTTISPESIESDCESDQNFNPETNAAQVPPEILSQNSFSPYITAPPMSSSTPFQKFLEMVHTTVAPHTKIGAPTMEHSQPTAPSGNELNSVPIPETINNTPVPSELNQPSTLGQNIPGSNLQPDSTADPAALFETNYPTFNTQMPSLSTIAPQVEEFDPTMQSGVAPSAISYPSYNAPNTAQNNYFIQGITPQMPDETMMTTLPPGPNYSNDPTFTAQQITAQKPTDNESCDDDKPPETTTVDVLDPTTGQVIKSPASGYSTTASATESPLPITTSFFPNLPTKPQPDDLVFNQQKNTFDPQPTLASGVPLSPSTGDLSSVHISSNNDGQSDPQTTLPTSFTPQQLPAFYEPTLAPLPEFEQSMIGAPAAEIQNPQMLPSSFISTVAPPTSPNDDEDCDSSSSPITTSAPPANGAHEDDIVISDPYSSAPLGFNGMTSSPQNLHLETPVHDVNNQSPSLSEFPNSIKKPLADTDTEFSPPGPFVGPAGIPSIASTPSYWDQFPNGNIQNEPGTIVSKDSSFILNPNTFSEQPEVSTIAPPTTNPLLPTQTTVTPELGIETIIPKTIVTKNLPNGDILKIKEDIITTRHPTYVTPTPQAHPNSMNQYATSVPPSHYEKVLSTLGPNEELLSYEEKIIATENLGPATVPQLTTPIPPMSQTTAPSEMSLPEAFSTAPSQTTMGVLGTPITPSNSLPGLPDYVNPNTEVRDPANILQPNPNALVPGQTIPSISTGEEPNPLQCSFNTEYIRNMTAPSYYILVTKVQDAPEERFKVEKVFLGDGTPLNCPLTEQTLFPSSRYRPIPFTNPKPLTFMS